jgi:polyphosphate kinase 2 (PPK2 family)
MRSAEGAKLGVTGEPDAAASIGALSSDTFAMPGTPGAGHGATSIDTSTPQFAAAARRAQMQHAFAPRGSRFPIVDTPPTVDGINHALTLAPDAYKRQLKELQARLFRLENMMYQARIPLVIMYEGWDAAGKGGNIKRVAQALDARAYTIFPSPAPTKPELAHPHLWRYWQHLPKAGHVALFDRSWYGRVLVERVEELTPATRWSQGYDEINEFEHDLVDWGAILLKFWVDVSPDEQLARFNARAADPAKQWKITPDDWRNRDKYPQYKAAIDDMFRLTSTRHAPWVVLESDDKLYARIKALRIICDAIESRLNQQ